MLQGRAGAAFVIHRLPAGREFARGLTFALSIRDALAVPAGEGAYRATMALYDDFSEALDGEDAPTYSAFGGEATVVVMTSGIELGIESGFAVADMEQEFRAFVAHSASGASADAANPSAPAVLGSITVGARGADLAGRRPTVYAARGGMPMTAADVIESVEVTIEGDMTFGTLDLRTGTGADRCLATSPPTATSPGGGVVALSPPVGEAPVTTVGIARLAGQLSLWLFYGGVSLPGPGSSAGASAATRSGDGSNGCSTQATAYLRATSPARHESCAAMVEQSGTSRIAPPSQSIRRRINATENRGVLTG